MLKLRTQAAKILAPIHTRTAFDRVTMRLNLSNRDTITAFFFSSPFCGLTHPFPAKTSAFYLTAALYI